LFLAEIIQDLNRRRETFLAWELASDYYDDDDLLVMSRLEFGGRKKITSSFWFVQGILILPHTLYLVQK
jgi:hypothetical protein